MAPRTVCFFTMRLRILRSLAWVCVGLGGLLAAMGVFAAVAALADGGDRPMRWPAVFLSLFTSLGGVIYILTGSACLRRPTRSVHAGLLSLVALTFWVATAGAFRRMGGLESHRPDGAFVGLLAAGLLYYLAKWTLLPREKSRTEAAGPAA